uniref:Protein artichoke-like n=1 Tax=Dermatophagoides pteronyssinus TaxID=6956 RepID=A0A6P6XTC4_DERPT|nr:protein artichoke-like [Dermatophagoides pteronyssinus]
MNYLHRHVSWLMKMMKLNIRINNDDDGDGYGDSDEKEKFNSNNYRRSIQFVDIFLMFMMFMIHFHRHRFRYCQRKRNTVSARSFYYNHHRFIIYLSYIFCLSTSISIMANDQILISRSSSSSMVTRSLPLVQRHSPSYDSNNYDDNSTIPICPLYINNDNDQNNMTTLNPCHCYGSIKMGIFIECTGANIRQINQTFDHLRQQQQSQSKAVHSLSIYRLNTSLSSLPDYLFHSFTSINELHISSTNLTRIGTIQTFNGLEESLHSLSFVDSQISIIPKSTLSKLSRLKSLDLQSNHIANLDSYAFYGLPLRTLNLQNNFLKNLQEFAFGGLENTLEELILNANQLEHFPLFALRRLRKLVTLKLQSNQINQIPDDGFTRFTVLETLDLQSNQIRHLNSRSFMTMPKLKILYCSNNLLTVVSDSSIFAQLHFLETLDLSVNRLRVVNLDGLESIRTVDLSYNHLHDLRLQGLIGLRELFASNNNILQLLNETFMNTTGLEVLYLQHNAIHTITYNTFYRLQQLRLLDLSYNQIRHLHQSLFKNTNQLQSLYLDNNLIDDNGIEPGIFQELVELRDLRLQHNRLKHIRKGVFYSLPNLRDLDLQMNEIEIIESLESLASLQHLNLQGNRLTIFNGQILSKFPSSLRYLQLSWNQLDSIQNETFRGQNELEVIWLNNNHIKHITENVFNDLIHVEKLFLNHNEINLIDDDSFVSMKSLKYLNLEHNRLGHLGRNMFKGLEMLQELRLSSSEIIGIEPNMMEYLRSLEILDISDNQIYTLRRSMFHLAKNIHELYLRNVMADEIEVDSFEQLQSLRILDLSQNSINARRMNGIRLPSTIQLLNISHNNLSNKKGIELSPEFIHQLNNSLEILDLSHTHFRLTINSVNFFQPLIKLNRLHLDSNELIRFDNVSFPQSMNQLSTLTLQDNHFETIPLLLAKFIPNIQTLSLANNQIKKIPTNAFENLRLLQWLNLSKNRISIIESLAFNDLDQLQYLDLSGNVLRSLSSNVFDNLPRLKHLSLANNWLQYIPNNLFKSSINHTSMIIVRMDELNLDSNPMIRLREDLIIQSSSSSNSVDDFALITILRAQHGNLTVLSTNDFLGFNHLEQLILHDNQIQTISPSTFRSLSRLIVLDLSVNKLDNLPQERLIGLINLESLNISHNSLTELPLFANDLGKHLHTLDISFNRISRIESFGHLSSSLKYLSLRHNMISWIANNAFQNMTSLTMIDLRQNFLTQISETIFESIEVRLQSIMLAGNPFHCDCRLLSIYQWLEEHSRLVKFDNDEEMMICDQPEKLKHDSIQSLQPIDFCPIPLITLLEVNKIESSAIRLRWEVQNETLVGGFTLEYYLTSERSLTSPAGLQLNSGARNAELRDLVSEKWYTVCVEANGKYLRPSSSGTSMAASSSSSSSIESLDHRTMMMPSQATIIENDKPKAHYMISDNNYPIIYDDLKNKKPILQDFVSGNRKCSQIRTLSPLDGRRLITLPASSIIIAIGLFFMLLLSVCILTIIIFRFRRKRKIKLNNGNNDNNKNDNDDDDDIINVDDNIDDDNDNHGQQQRSSTVVSFGTVTTNSIGSGNCLKQSTVTVTTPMMDPHHQHQHNHHLHHHHHNHHEDNENGINMTEISELVDPVIMNDYITYRHFALPYTQENVYS